MLCEEYDKAEKFEIKVSKEIERRLCAEQSERHRGHYGEGTVFTDNGAAKSALSLWKEDYGIKGWTERYFRDECQSIAFQTESSAI